MAEPELLARFLLVRHGESQVMVDGVVGGMKTCSGLSNLGRRQAAALRDRFAAGGQPKIDAVWSSPMPRARETTEIVSAGIEGGSHEIHVHPQLEEFRLGEADGLTWDEVRETYGELFGRGGHPWEPIIPGGDSRGGFRERIGVALHEIALAHRGQTILVGCHGGVVNAALSAAFQMPIGQPTVDLPTVVTSITELEHRVDEQRNHRWLVRRYNDSSHLHGTDLDPEEMK